MKKGSRIMITGYNQEGSQTIDHYSLLGFTKAYGAAKKNCKIQYYKMSKNQFEGSKDRIVISVNSKVDLQK